MSVEPKIKVGRNDPCPCGSGLKFKHCHGDSTNQMICSRVANDCMMKLIRQEQKNRGLIPYQFTCDNCGHKFDEPKRGITSPMPLCPNCDCTNLSYIFFGQYD